MCRPFCVLFTVTLLFVLSKTFTIRDKLAFEKTMAEAYNNKCKDPQKRNIAADEILGKNVTSFCHTVDPPSAIILICDFACGTCPQNYQCLPKETEERDVAFRITPRIVTDKDAACYHVRNEKVRMESAVVLSHKKCSCQSLSNTPK